MSDTNNVHAVTILAPDNTGEVAIVRPCNLRGVWISPNDTDGVVDDTSIRFYNGSSVDASTLLLDLYVQHAEHSNINRTDIQTFPGNGIRFDTKVFIHSSHASADIVAITLFYQ